MAGASAIRVGGALVNLGGSGTSDGNGDAKGDACGSGSSIPPSHPIGGLVSIEVISATLLPRKSRRCFFRFGAKRFTDVVLRVGVNIAVHGLIICLDAITFPEGLLQVILQRKD